MNIPGFQCAQTGRCCRHKQVMLSIADVDRMAAHLGLSPGTVLAEQVKVLEIGGVKRLCLASIDEDWCEHLRDGQCGIHPARPDTCRLYCCDTALKSTEGFPWSLVFDHSSGLALIAERAIALERTQAYVDAHGNDWNEEAYAETAAAIRAECEESRRQTIRVMRKPDNGTGIVRFDCPGCAQRRNCCVDRPLTLLDIREMAAARGASAADFWAAHVAEEEPDKADGCLTLRRGAHGACALLDAGTNACTAAGAEPLHCRHIMCPALNVDPGSHLRYTLGAGRLWDQFRHSVAVVLTRRYVGRNGTRHDAAELASHLRLLDQVLADAAEYARFCQEIAPYRYDREAAIKTPPTGATAAAASA